MRRLGIIVATVISLSSWAQNNDEQLLIDNKVKEVRKMQKVHAFKNSDNLCAVEIKKLDEQGRVIYHMNDMRCMGWTGYEETFITYQKDRIATTLVKRDGEKFASSSYSYGKHKEPTAVSTFFYQTNDSMLVETKYFRTKKRVDSSYITTTLQDGSVMKTKSIARFNKDGDLVQVYAVDSSGTPTEMMSNEIDAKGILKSVAYTTYGERESFVQTFYECNEDGQIDNTVNTVNQKQKYFYLENGLIKNILAYNPKGELEIEYIFEYTYHE